MRSRPLLAAMVAAVALFYPLLAPTPHRIDQAHWERIENGMTRAQVEAIFGVPAGSYDWAEAGPSALWLTLTDGTSSTIVFDEFSCYPPGQIKLMGWSPTWSPSRHSTSIETSLSRWVSRQGAFTVHFDPDGRVAWKTTGEAKVVPPWQRCWRFLAGKL